MSERSLWEAVRRWPRAAQIATGCAVVVAIVAVAIALSGGEKNRDFFDRPDIRVDPTGCGAVCGDSPLGEPSKWPDSYAMTFDCAEINGGIYPVGAVRESLDAAIEYCASSPKASDTGAAIAINP